ncbi:MAG: substrate-binding domain-containing protein [Campylobacterota bacterium]|nr:substrate-binding domain-containing protein [Campylobacterota bacterium]
MKKIILSMALVSSALLADIAVIVNPGSGVDALDASQVKKIFMAKSKKFPNGSSVTPIDQNTDNGIYATFYKAVAGKSPTKMNKYWVKLTFTGKAEAPQKVASDSDVLAKVKSDKKMIGYIDSSAVTSDVKVVYTVK